MLAWVADALVVLGLVVMTIGVFGIFRMETVYLELHASSKAIFLGVIALIVASFSTLDTAILAKGSLIIVFLLMTTPVAAHVIARSVELAERNRNARD